jgi:hypothetical protein
MAENEMDAGFRAITGVNGAEDETGRRYPGVSSSIPTRHRRG